MFLHNSFNGWLVVCAINLIESYNIEYRSQIGDDKIQDDFVLPLYPTITLPESAVNSVAMISAEYSVANT